MTHADFVFPDVRVTLLECPFHNYETRAAFIFDHALPEESQLFPPGSFIVKILLSTRYGRSNAFRRCELLLTDGGILVGFQEHLTGERSVSKVTYTE